MRRAARLPALACLATACVVAAPAAQVVQPRAFGHVVGAVFAQRVRLGSFEPGELPPAARLGLWLERRGSRIESSTDGGRWLVIDYQVISAPREAATVVLPAFELPGANGQGALPIPAAPVMIAPLAPREPAEAGLPAFQPDRAAIGVDTGALRRRTLGWAAAALLALAAWPAWFAWRNARAAASRPFARAWRVVHAAGDTAPQSWQALHRAFDAAAGRVVPPGGVAALFERAPQLAPLRADIERFYLESGSLFFGAGTGGTTLPLRELCQALRRIERQHEA